MTERLAAILDELNIDGLTVPERLELIGRIGDTPTPDAEVRVPEWPIRQWEQRMAAADSDPGPALSWETDKARSFGRS